MLLDDKNSEVGVELWFDRKLLDSFLEGECLGEDAFRIKGLALDGAIGGVSGISPQPHKG